MTASDNQPKPAIEFVQEIFYPDTPIEFLVTEFTHVRRIRVVLRCKKKTDYKFYINLKNGEDIVMQMDPRVLEKRFIFNSFYNGHWQVEETIPMIGGPFIADIYYTVDFVPTRFHSVFVYVDGRFTYEFRERQPGFKVRSVEIGGDVQVHSVHFT
ncbi:galactoside-binding lectin, partial [Ancylostoma duodenale]